MSIIYQLNELAKVPPTEIYMVSEMKLLKENLENLMKVVNAAKYLQSFTHWGMSGAELKASEALNEAINKLDGEK